MTHPFWHGCNYPWSTDGTTIYYGLDFGDNVWGSHLGVSTRKAAIERDFAEMAALCSHDLDERERRQERENAVVSA